ncbi:MAG: type II toxin-antitoxin system prevent-host-death family antitoxin [Microbacteriaceae bacterium]|nr:type II toxin-antitoxin system prevent-host-death family antitoxin [Microbacteriaceae bacterium]
MPTVATDARRTISLAEAKAKLSALVDAAEAGEIITITRHGHPVARLMPIRESRRSPREAIEAWETYREAHPIDIPTDFSPYDRSTLGHPEQ